MSCDQLLDWWESRWNDRVGYPDSTALLQEAVDTGLIHRVSHEIAAIAWEMMAEGTIRPATGVRLGTLHEKVQ